MAFKHYEFQRDIAMRECVDWIKQYFIKNGTKDTIAVVGISGGKDSSVVAALLEKALGKDRVLGVKMPDGEQDDIWYANKLIQFLDIHSTEINIKNICDSFYTTMNRDTTITFSNCPAVYTNLPARIRMAVLYSIAAREHGRVTNTCNLSENYIGYSTKFGDSAGDFAPIAKFTSDEVIQIGRALNLPTELLLKPPADGLSGKTDEENFGFSYTTLNSYIRKGIIPDYETLRDIKDRHNRNRHKIEEMPTFNPSFESFTRG